MGRIGVRPTTTPAGERVRRKGNGAGILATLESDFFDSRIWPRRIAFASRRVRVLKRLLVGRVVKVSESWLGSGSGFERAPRERGREVCCGDGALERTDPGREEGRQRRSPQPAAVLELAVEEQETRAPGDDPGGQVPTIDTTREGRSSPPESVRPHPGGRGALCLRHADRVLPGQLVPPGGREAAAGDVTRGS